MKGGGGGRNFKVGDFFKERMGRLDFFQGSFFGFVSDREASEVEKGGKMGFLAVFGEVISKTREVGLQSGLKDGVVGLVGLDDNRSGVEMTATDAADDLSKKLEGALFGGEVGESEAGVGLDDADGGEVGKIQAAGEGLGADQDVDGTGLNIIVEAGKSFRFLIVAVETGDFGFGEEFGEFGFEEFGTKTFMNDTGVATFWAVHGDFFGVSAEVAA